MNDGPVTWDISEEGKVSFSSFLGKTKEELTKEGYSTLIDTALLSAEKEENGKMKLTYMDAYRTSERLPFSACKKTDDLWIWSDPMRRQMIATMDRYDFTFYGRATGLFSDTEDLEKTFPVFRSRFSEDDVDRYYFLIDRAASGKYQITIGRHRDKKEKKFSVFAKNVIDLFRQLITSFSLFKEALSKDVYIEEKEDKRKDEDLTRDDD